MATTDWKKLLSDAQSKANGSTGGSTAGTQTGADKAGQDTQKVNVNALSSVNPSQITQSYYQTPTNSGNYEAGRPVYQQSQAVTDAANALKQQQENKPDAYESTWDNQIQGLINQALNRPAFTYDATTDPTYQMYEEKYKTQGQALTKGTVGEYSAQTGGYGNSYAQQQGQTAYQQQMQALNDMIPQLRQQAYEQYQTEGDRMYQNLSMLQTEENREYGKYRDEVGDYRDELNYLYGAFSDMSQQEYERYANDRQAWEADRAYWYQKAYDEQQQRNWEKLFAAMYG